MPAWFLPMLCRAVCAATLLLLGGCAGVPFAVQAERFELSDGDKRTYRIVSTHPTLSATDPAFVRVADYVRSALAYRGFFEAPADQPAGIVVEIFFEQLPPRVETRVSSESIYGTVPEQVVTETKKTKMPDGTVVKEKVNRTIPERTEEVGTTQTIFTVTLFPKRLRITGRDSPESTPAANIRRLWFVEVTNEDQVDDFEGYLLLMVAAAMDYLGENLSGRVFVAVERGDDRTQVILSGITGPPEQAVIPVASR